MNLTWIRAYIGLGANLGDRLHSLETGLNLLQNHGGIRIVQVSSWYETDPVGMNSESPMFLNGVAELSTHHPPLDLLDILLQIERRLGRNRFSRTGPESRTIDLDLLIYGNAARKDERLILPHPRLHERLFVLVPFAEIASEFIIPGLNRNVTELLDSLRKTTNESEPRCLWPSRFQVHHPNE